MSGVCEVSGPSSKTWREKAVLSIDIKATNEDCNYAQDSVTARPRKKFAAFLV